MRTGCSTDTGAQVEALMGRWLHHVVDPNATKANTTSGKIGFTMNQNVAISDDVSVVAIEKAYRDNI